MSPRDKIETNAEQSAAKPADSPALERCKHDVEMVNEVNERLLKIRAVLDLMMCTHSHELLDDTLNNVSWLLLDLVNDTKEIVNEKEEAQA